MLHRLILAAALAAGLSGAAQAQTTRSALTTSAWVDICAAPCRVKVTDGTALLVFDSAAPATLDAPATTVASSNGVLPADRPGIHIYGRAQTGATTLISAWPGPVGQPVDTVVQSTAVYRGGTIATGGASQSLMAANTARRGFTVQNQSTADLYIKIGGAAATTNNLSLRVSPGQLYESPDVHVPTSAIAIIGATTGQAFYATEF